MAMESYIQMEKESINQLCIHVEKASSDSLAINKKNASNEICVIFKLFSVFLLQIQRLINTTLLKK